MEILNVKNLGFTYAGAASKALTDISFTVNKGDLVLMLGATGSGKSTLLRLLKREVAPQGAFEGTVTFDGKDFSQMTDLEGASRIGFVCQQPEQQIVCDKVWHELAFGLENLGCPSSEIRKRVSEMAAYFGIEEWFMRSTAELSGGEKQLLNLASVMVMQPDIILLDEPTAQLDPIAASSFITSITKLNREFGTTVIVVEHRLEELLPEATNLLALKDGRIQFSGSVSGVIKNMSDDRDILPSLPAAVRLFPASCPLTVADARRLIADNYKNTTASLNAPGYSHSDSIALEFSHVYFRYEKNLPDVLSDLSLTVFESEIFCLLGGNGSGKTTLLSAAAGLVRPFDGVIRVFCKKIKDYKGQELRNSCVAYLPQDVQTLFLRNTVREELHGTDLSQFPFDLSHLMDRHPYDLSGGEQELLALALVLSQHPRILLADEPTKGLDALNKDRITGIFKDLRSKGITVVIVTHDTEFAAKTANRCALLFRGDIMSEGTPREFFGSNAFYTTPASRMTRGIYKNAVTVEDVSELLRINGRRS